MNYIDGLDFHTIVLMDHHCNRLLVMDYKRIFEMMNHVLENHNWIKIIKTNKNIVELYYNNNDDDDRLLTLISWNLNIQIYCKGL